MAEKRTLQQEIEAVLYHTPSILITGAVSSRFYQLLGEAADALAAQRERIRVLEEALEHHQRVFFGRKPDMTHMDRDEFTAAYAEAYERARAALGQKPSGEGGGT